MHFHTYYWVNDFLCFFFMFLCFNFLLLVEIGSTEFPWEMLFEYFLINLVKTIHFGRRWDEIWSEGCHRGRIITIFRFVGSILIKGSRSSPLITLEDTRHFIYCNEWTIQLLLFRQNIENILLVTAPIY